MCFASVGRAWLLSFSFMAVSVSAAVLSFLDNNAPQGLDGKDSWGFQINSCLFMAICINYKGAGGKAGFFLY